MFILKTIKIPVLVLRLWNALPYRSGLPVISGTSLHLQRLTYFAQVRLTLSEPVLPHKSGLHAISGTSLHLQRLMYFPQVRLALSEP